MEKKLALILLSVVALGFWATTLLMFTGNPFAETQGTYHYNISNVTISIPPNWLRGSSNPSGDNFASLAPRLAQNTTIRGDYIYVHLGNITIDLEGKNWELFITRIMNNLAPYIILSNLADRANSDSYYSVPTQNYIYAFGIIALGLVGGWAAIKGLEWGAPRLYRRVRRVSP